MVVAIFLMPYSLIADSRTGFVGLVRVGLFSEAKCTDPKSREAAWKVISNAPGLAAERITTETIHSPALNKYDVVILPGGTANGEAKALGVDGGTTLTKFVRDGHGLIAICAGGYLVCKGWNPETRAIELVNAESFDDNNGHWARGEQFISVKVVGVDDAHSSQTIWYENGPIFVPGDLAGLLPYAPLVRYVTDLSAKGAPKGMMTGRDAIIAAPLGRGRVVAFGPHPELSPDLNHWLVNAIKWAAAGDDGTSPTAETVLEGRSSADK